MNVLIHILVLKKKHIQILEIMILLMIVIGTISIALYVIRSGQWIKIMNSVQVENFSISTHIERFNVKLRTESRKK